MKKKFTLSEKINHYISVLVHSFTWQTLILSLINWDSYLINAQEVLQYFAVSVAITLLMAITDIFTLKRSLPVIILTDLLDIAVVVFGLGGGVFKWFDFNLETILPIVGIIVFIYFIIFGLMMFQMKMDSDHINKKIKERISKENNNE